MILSVSIFHWFIFYQPLIIIFTDLREIHADAFLVNWSATKRFSFQITSVHIHDIDIHIDHVTIVYILIWCFTLSGATCIPTIVTTRPFPCFRKFSGNGRVVPIGIPMYGLALHPREIPSSLFSGNTEPLGNVSSLFTRRVCLCFIWLLSNSDGSIIYDNDIVIDM